MIIRFYFICVFAVLIHKVSLQVTVEAVFGGSVVLPCSSAKHDHKPQDIEVFWRHNGSKIVFDIIKGKDSVKGQDPRYKNRVQTFPEEYVRGNFSLKLNNLQHTDSGKYTCFISHSSEHETVELIIDETTTEYGTKSPKTENGTKSADQENQNPETGLLWVYIIIIAVLIMLIACFIIGCRKKIQAALFSPVMTEDKEQRQK
ncbi:CD276 antigen homolog [Onychostoma macrolepis]|uniref:CD276 antigen homolog n=1 Tax=Onychostoma macrolepis TaxID=369639 RepID=UPI00272D6F5B|nr:CD276 antigen homolog [Onychostoma macrolepis]